MRRLLAVATAGLAVVLAGCSTPSLDLPNASDLPNVGPTTVGPGTVSCSHGLQYNLTEPGSYTLDGNCDLVTITGKDITVSSPVGFGALTIDGDGNSVRAQDTGAVTIDGDDNNVTAGALGLLTVQGAGNQVAAPKIGVTTLTGDENTIDAGENLAGVTVSGNNNNIRARTIGPTADNGTGNTITEG